MRLAPIAIALLWLVSVAASADDAMIHVGHNRLEPATVTIAVGDSVTFHNQDEMPGGHTVVADDGSFSSPPLGKDERWSRTFDAAGSVGIHIKEHPSAKATIEVR